MVAGWAKLQANAHGARQEGFRRLGTVLSRPMVAIVVAAMTCALGLALIPGISRNDYEEDIVQLYTHRDSRLRPELAIAQDAFGGETRREATIHTAFGQNAATPAGLDAMLASLTPAWKEDERDLCSSLDDERALVNCSVLSAPTDSLYCSCAQEAASPQAVTLAWPTTSGATATLTTKDLCESPPVPSAMAPSIHVSYKAHEEKAPESRLFGDVFGSTIQTLESRQPLPAFYFSAKASAMEECRKAFQANEQQLLAQGQRSDLVASALACAAAAFVTFGSQYTLFDTPTLSIAGLVAIWANVALPNANPLDLINTYNLVSGSQRGAEALVSVQKHSALAQSSAVLVAGASLAAFSASQFAFAAQGNILAYGYAEVANCISKETHANRAAFVAQAYGAHLALQRQRLEGSVAWVEAGVRAVEAEVDRLLQAGAQLSNQAIAGASAAYLDINRVPEPFLSVVNASLVETGIQPNSFSILAAMQAVVTALMQGRSLETPETQSSAVAAFLAAGGDAAHATLAVRAVFLGLMAQSQVAANVTQAVVTAKLFQANLPSLLMPEALTVKQQLRPLPRTWGIDRFPCSRATSLDVFREGDFDLPYRMKQLQEVAPYVFYWFTQLEYLESSAMCASRSLVQPLKDATYTAALATNPYLYQTINFPAFLAAERAHLESAGLAPAVAGAAAAQAFIAAGGLFFNASNPFQPPVAFQSAAGQVLAATAVGQQTLALVAGAAGAAANAGSLSQMQLITAANSFAAFGYWYRPAYGPHRTALQRMDTTSILHVFQDAVLAPSLPNVTVLNCLLHNTDAATLQGANVRGCFLSWAGTFVPAGNSVGTLKYRADKTLEAIAAHRTGINLFNPKSLTLRDRLTRLLQREISSAEAEDIVEAFEGKLLDHWAPLGAKSDGSGFARHEPFQDQEFFFLVGRSVADLVDQIAETETGLVIGGYVTMLFYLMFMYYRYREPLQSHAVLAGAGVGVVAFATAASLGLSAYFGIPFSALSSNVVPYVALGIGVDDALVFLSTYVHVLRRESMFQDSSAERVLATTMTGAGPSMLFTTLVNMVAFGVASTLPISVVSTFCHQMLLSVALNLFFILFLFVPLVLLDCKHTLTTASQSYSLAAGSWKSESDPGPEVAGGSSEGHPNAAFGVQACAFMRRAWPELYTHPWAKTLLCFGSLLFFALMAWHGFGKLEPGLAFSRMAQEGSYQREFYTRVEDLFELYAASLVTRSSDFASEALQQNLLQVVASLPPSPWVDGSVDIGSQYWLNRMLSESGFPLNSDGVLPKSVFYRALGSWLGGLGITALNDLVCEKQSTGARVSCYELAPQGTSMGNSDVRLVASRGTFYLTPLQRTEDFLDAIRDTRRRIDSRVREYSASAEDPSYHTFGIGEVYIFWEQYLHAFEDLYKAVGLCAVGVFAATFLLQLSLRIALLLSVLVLMVGIEVFGAAHVLGLELNAFSSTNIVLSLGLAVEFSCHLAHAGGGMDRDGRVLNALRAMGVPMIHGAVSSILAVLFIAASKTPFLREYYCGMFVAMVLIAFFNGVVFFPVLLTLLGPGALESRENGKETTLFPKFSDVEEIALPLALPLEDGAEPVPPLQVKHADSDFHTGTEPPSESSHPSAVRLLPANAVVLVV